MGVIAPCHTHLKLSLPGRQRQCWIEAWQCNSRVSTLAQLPRWALTTQPGHCPDRRRERRTEGGRRKKNKAGVTGVPADTESRQWKFGGTTGELTGINQGRRRQPIRSVRRDPQSRDFEDGRSEQEELLSEQRQHPGHTYIHTHRRTDARTHTLPWEGQCLVSPVEDEEALSPGGSSQLVQHSGPDLPHLRR